MHDGGDDYPPETEDLKPRFVTRRWTKYVTSVLMPEY
jgi:hypothetical protein